MPSLGITGSELTQLRSGQLQLEDLLELEPAVVKYNVTDSTMRSCIMAITRDNWVLMVALVLAYMNTYAVFPGVLSYIEWPAVAGWGTLIIQVFFGVGDVVGKCLPIFEPPRPHTTFGLIALSRLLFIPVFYAGLLAAAGPAFFAPMTLALTFTGGYESSVFAFACKGLHHEDAFLVEAVLAVMVQIGSLLGTVFSLLLTVGPWVAAAAADGGGGGGSR